MSKQLAADYFRRARGRRQVLEILVSTGLHADAVRESQELVELVLKGFLRQIGIDPPKVHDVGPFLIQYQDALQEPIKRSLNRIVAISKALRKEREFSFYGDEDMIPSECYGSNESTYALEQVDFVLGVLKEIEDAHE